jgi:hypothetical protein
MNKCVRFLQKFTRHKSQLFLQGKKLQKWKLLKIRLSGLWNFSKKRLSEFPFFWFHTFESFHFLAFRVSISLFLGFHFLAFRVSVSGNFLVSRNCQFFCVSWFPYFLGVFKKFPTMEQTIFREEYSLALDIFPGEYSLRSHSNSRNFCNLPSADFVFSNSMSKCPNFCRNSQDIKVNFFCSEKGFKNGGFRNPTFGTLEFFKKAAFRVSIFLVSYFREFPFSAFESFGISRISGL